MGQFISVKEASQRIGVTPRTVRGWIQDLKGKDPRTYSTHILPHSHRFNKNLETYTLTEELVNEWGNSFRTHFRTHFSAQKEPVIEPEKQDQGNTGRDTTGQEVLRGVIDTLQAEIAAQRETLNRLLQDHAKERERADTIIMQLRGDVKLLNDKIMLLAEGPKEQAEPPEETTKQVKTEQPETPGKAEEYRFTVGDRVYFLKEDIKRILNKRIF